MLRFLYKGGTENVKEQRWEKAISIKQKNWKLLYTLPKIATTVSFVDLGEVIIYRYDVREERISDLNYRGVHEITKYRIDMGNHVSEEVPMTYLIETLGKIKQWSTT